jgi:methionyl-tRNA formyltransferase
VGLAPVPVHPRRLVFLGTPDMAVPPLQALAAAGFDVALVVTRADKRRGRGAEVSPSPVKAAALELGLTVVHRVDDALEVGADLGVVVAYGALVKPHVLAVLPMVNVHFSLLPRWRGAAPVERAILAGDDETGVAVMQLEEGLDTGPVFACERVAIEPGETAVSLRARLVVAGTDLLVRTLVDGLHDPQPQVGEATFAAKLGPADLELDWAAPAVALDRVVRVGDAWTTFRGRRLKVQAARPEPVRAGSPALAPGHLDGERVGTGEGDLVVITVQPEGRAPQPMAAWRNGARPRSGEALGR